MEVVSFSHRWYNIALPAPCPVAGEKQLLALDAASGQVAARFTGLDLTLSASGYNFAQRPSVIGGTVYAPMVNLLIAFERPE